MRSILHRAFCMVALGASVACGGHTLAAPEGSGGTRPVDSRGDSSDGTGGSGTGGRAAVTVGVGGSGVGGIRSGGAGGSVGGAPATGGPDGGSECVPYERRVPCDQGFDCITDFRAVASRFTTCFMGPSGMPYHIRCGPYDVVAWTGSDTGAAYYFDHSSGQFVGFRTSGADAEPCHAVAPILELPVCDYPPRCPLDDAGGVQGRLCTGGDPADAGPPPVFCPVAASQRPALGSMPALNQEQDTVTVKFVEGSHVRSNGEPFVIDPLAMLDEDPELLRCAHLTVPEAACDVQSLDESLATHAGVSVTRVFAGPETDLDNERAAARATSGEYLDDRNLFYTVRAPAEQIGAIYDLLAGSPVVDTVYYNSKPSTP